MFVTSGSLARRSRGEALLTSVYRRKPRENIRSISVSLTLVRALLGYVTELVGEHQQRHRLLLGVATDQLQLRQEHVEGELDGFCAEQRRWNCV